MASASPAKIDSFVRSCLRELETTADREALRLLCEHGVFAINDPSAIAESARSLWAGRHTYDAKQVKAFARVEKAGLTEHQQKLVGKCDDLQNEELSEMIDAAYLLGIAVGRRLGAGTLARGAR